MMEEDAHAALRSKLWAMRELGATQAEIDAVTAQNVLHEDLGYYRTKTAEYDLDQAHRDKLLAHARQDAAHAVYAGNSAEREVRKLRTLVLLLLALSVVTIAVVLWRT